MISFDKKLPIDLEKKEQVITAMLRERGLRDAPTMRVAVALDVSGSMDSVIRRGDLQKAVDQLGGVAVKFDDNGEIDVWTFDHGHKRVASWKPEDYGTYVASQRLRASGGTEYAGVIREITKAMFSGGGFFKRASKEPVLAIMITDGEPSDSLREIEQAIEASAGHPIYWSLVGVGGGSFATLDHLGDKYDNVGFVKLSGFGLSDAEVYNKLISEELVENLKKF